jgi:hypothetical protein
MVKPARAAGKRTGVRESIGRRQNQIPAELSRHFALCHCRLRSIDGNVT